jgi:hypothetical protein
MPPELDLDRKGTFATGAARAPPVETTPRYTMLQDETGEDRWYDNEARSWTQETAAAVPPAVPRRPVTARGRAFMLLQEVKNRPGQPVYMDFRHEGRPGTAATAPPAAPTLAPPQHGKGWANDAEGAPRAPRAVTWADENDSIEAEDQFEDWDAALDAVAAARPSYAAEEAALELEDKDPITPAGSPVTDAPSCEIAADYPAPSAALEALDISPDGSTHNTVALPSTGDPAGTITVTAATSPDATSRA